MKESIAPLFKGLKGSIALIAAGIILGLLVGELGLRLLGLGQPGFYQWDTYRGWALRPGASGWQRREGNAFVSINHDGMRDRELTYQKPKDTIRIAFIGDSFTEAEQVPMEDDFVSVTEQRLAQCPRLHGMKIETMNFGCDSYGTAQELTTLRRAVWKYSPDVVVLTFFPGNDLRNNSINLEWHFCQPFYLLRGDKLVLGGPFIDSAAFRTKCQIKFESRSVALLNVIGNAFTQLRTEAKVRKSGHSGHGSRFAFGPAELGLDDGIYKAPLDPVWENAWTVTEKLLAMTSDEVRAHGAQFLVVTATVGRQVYPNPIWRAKREKNIGVTDLLYPDHRIEDLGRRTGFPVLDLVPPFQGYADEHHVFLHGFRNTKMGDGHWNEAGHRLAGELIAQRLCDLLDQTRASPGALRASINPTTERHSQ